MWQSCPAGGHTISCVFWRGRLPLFWMVIFCGGWTKFQPFAFGSHLYHPASPEVHPQDVNLWDLQLLNYQWKPAKLSQYSTWRDPLHWFINIHKHTHKIIHAHKHFLSLSACSATNTRHKGQGTSSNTEWHCSTFGTVFVATLEDFEGHMHKQPIFSS